MILADTSVWVDHLKKGNRELTRLLDDALVVMHPWVLGELALGGVSSRTLGLLAALPAATSATEDELLDFITRERLAGSGIGYVDTQLLAATRLTSRARLWTLDSKLKAVAERLSLVHR
jgi:predicted nucleic acid-binding protein